MPRRRPELLVLALDVGSSSLRSALFDQTGRAVAGTSAQREYALRYSAGGGAELSPALLRRAAAGCLAQTLRPLREVPIAAVGGCAFWHSLLALDRAGQPLTPVFTWADSRSTEDARALREKFSEREIQRRTGAMLRASFWPAKLRWLRRTQPAIWKRAARWVSPSTWIFRELFGIDQSSHSMASATGLYNLRARTWDAELCDFCGLRLDQLDRLADVVPFNRRSPRILRGATLCTAIGDGVASNLGSGADEAGSAAINVGTSAAVRLIQTQTKRRPEGLPFGLFRFVVDEGRTILGGAVSNGGNLRKWCLNNLRLEETPAEMRRSLSRASAARDAITILPFWVNERAPTWPEGLRGTILGLTQATSATEILRAATCSTYYRLAEILELMETVTARTKRVIVSGGIIHSAAPVRLLADALGRDVEICPEGEASLRGAALHALAILGQKAKPLRRGSIIRHEAEFAVKHRERRLKQSALEQVLRRAHLGGG